jgi:Fe2+ transport system protein B
MSRDRSGQPYTLVDLPGIPDLCGSSEDEAAVKRYLRNTPPDLILLALNMSEEARRLGIRIDHDRRSSDLQVLVRAISAKRKQGIHELLDALVGAWTAMLNFLVTMRVFIVGGAAAIWLLTHLHPGAVGRVPFQALSFMTFVLLYTPCLGTVAVQLQESRSRGFVILSPLWSLGLAWLMSLVVFQGGRLLIG